MPKEQSALILYNESGQILLQLRSEYKKRYANHWGLFGGGIEEGETPEEGLLREMREELGYAVTNPEKFMIAEAVEGLPPLHIFSELYTGGSITLDPLESQEMRWFAPEEIEMLEPMIPWDKIDVLKFCEHLKTRER